MYSTIGSQVIRSISLSWESCSISSSPDCCISLEITQYTWNKYACIPLCSTCSCSPNLVPSLDTRLMLPWSYHSHNNNCKLRKDILVSCLDPTLSWGKRVWWPLSDFLVVPSQQNAISHVTQQRWGQGLGTRLQIGWSVEHMVAWRAISLGCSVSRLLTQHNREITQWFLVRGWGLGTTLYTAAGLQLRVHPEVMPQALHHLELQVDYDIQNCLQHTHQIHYMM